MTPLLDLARLLLPRFLWVLSTGDFRGAEILALHQVVGL
jgi:hypothetical protein